MCVVHVFSTRPRIEILRIRGVLESPYDIEAVRNLTVLGTSCEQRAGARSWRAVATSSSSAVSVASVVSVADAVVTSHIGCKRSLYFCQNNCLRSAEQACLCEKHKQSNCVCSLQSASVQSRTDRQKLGEWARRARRARREGDLSRNEPSVQQCSSNRVASISASALRYIPQKSRVLR